MATALIVGPIDSEVAQCRLAKMCNTRGLEPVFLSAWEDWAMRMFPHDSSFTLAQKRSGGLHVHSKTIRDVMMFGIPIPPSVPEEDAKFSCSEWEALLHALCAIAAPRLADRWKYLLAGLSDTVQASEAGLEHPLVSSKVLGALCDADAVEAAVLPSGIFYRRQDKLVRSLPNVQSVRRLEVTLSIDPRTRTFIPFAGLLPQWLLNDSSTLSSLTFDRTPTEPTNLAWFDCGRAHERLCVVAAPGDLTASHLLHVARHSGDGTNLVDLAWLYARTADDVFFDVVDGLAEADFVYARPKLELVPNSGQDPARIQARHLELLRVLQRRTQLTINRPASGWSCVSKPALLSRLAGQTILDIPRTLVTNDPAAVFSFRDEIPDLVYKSAGPMRSIATKFSAFDLHRLGHLPNCPAMFQEFVPGINCRAHVVKDKVLTVGIEAPSTDYRYSFAPPRFSEVVLNSAISSELSRIVQREDLVLGGCDLRWDAEKGNWSLLEINRTPAFEYYDHEIGNRVATQLLSMRGQRTGFDPEPQVC